MYFLDKNTVDIFPEWYANITDTGSFVLINKETDWTSFDVVAKLRSLMKVKKIGHAGTLDPLATGLLIVGLGKNATKRLDEFQSLSKIYSGRIKLGATTKTDDSEAAEENNKALDHLTEGIILSAVNTFVGEIEQTPPMYSARKVKGQRLYKLARKNIEIEVPSSKVVVYEFNIMSIELPFLDFEIKCSKGTYIRSLARDLGMKLGVGGYLLSLMRTGIGEYRAKDALSVKEMVDLKDVFLKKEEN